MSEYLAIDSLNHSIKSENTSSNETLTGHISENILTNIIITCSYSLIVIVSLCGNLLVCKTIWTKTKHNSTNLLIANLSLSDILMTIFNIPFTVVDILLSDWIFGQFFCIIVPFIQSLCVYVSSFSMLIIAVNRWKSIYHKPCRPRSRSSGSIFYKLFIVIALIWIIAAIHSLPHTAFNQVILLQTQHKGIIRRCRTIAPTIIPKFQLWTTLITFMTQYLIPLAISAIIYLRIGFTIASLGKVSSALNEEQRNQLCYKKRRRILLLVLIVLIFGICWLPFHIYYVMADLQFSKYNFRIFLWCHWLAMSSLCYNPFVYFWLNDNFRSDTKNIIKLLWRLKNNSNDKNFRNGNEISFNYKNTITNDNS